MERPTAAAWFAGTVSAEEMAGFHPKVVHVDGANRIRAIGSSPAAA